MVQLIFFYGIPHFAISLALKVEDEIISGFNFDLLKMKYFMQRKMLVHLINRIRVFQINQILMNAHFHRIMIGIKLIYPKPNLKNTGCAALDLAYVGCGRFDGYFHVRCGILLLEKLL